MTNIIYLACPYTDPDPAVRLLRFNKATETAAHLVEQGNIVYSPITHTHPIDVCIGEDGATLGSEFWVDFDEAFMIHCTSIIVLTIDGWRQSSGVAREIQHFLNRDIHPEYISYREVSN